MMIGKQKDGDTLTLAITGRIDTQTSLELKKVIEDSIGDVKELVLDFEGVDYISSAGLRIILLAENWMTEKKGTLVIRHVAKNILYIFKVTGFDSFLTIE